jgi:hypothetical protein
MGKMCINQCMQTQSMCQQMCQIANQNCQLQAKEQARLDFAAYRKQRNRQHKAIKKDLNDFNRFGSCQNSCDCLTNYHLCYQNCGGQIIEHKVCTAFCDHETML